MKVLTIILVVMLVLVLALFGTAALKYIISGSNSDDLSTTEDTIPVETVETTMDTQVETTDEILEIPEDEIASVEIYLDGDREDGIFLGEAVYGETSEEAISIYGPDFSDIGFSFSTENKDYTFEPGSTHYFYVYTYIEEYGWEYIRKKVVIEGTADINENIKLSIDSPAYGTVVGKDGIQEMKVAGWAFDSGVLDSTGIESVEIYLNGPKGFGKFLGEADYGIKRPDVAAVYNNAAYTNSGYIIYFDGSGLEGGRENTLYIYYLSDSGSYNLGIRNFTIEDSDREPGTVISAEVKLENNGSLIQVDGWAVNQRFILEGRPRDLDKEYTVKKIIFTSSQTGNEDIFSMNIDGSEITRLTDNSGKDNYPAVSPDGKKIAYTSDINGTWQIMTMNWDGTEKTQITYNPWRTGYPSWSYDGRYIFFEVYQDGDWEIYRINSDGSGMKRLTINPNANDWHPYGHPFLYKVLYESGSVGNEGIYIMDYNGKNMETLLNNNMRERVPFISTDGSTLVYMGYEGNNSMIYRLDIENGNSEIVSGQLNNCGHPSISPDNQLIAFESPSDQGEIYIINFDGSGLTRLTNIGGHDYDPVFMYQSP